MIRTFIKENPDEIWFRIRHVVNTMFDDAYKLEVSWMKYASGGIFSDELIESTVAYFVRKRARAIGMYDEEEDRNSNAKKATLVNKLESFGAFNDTKTNFFEGTVKNYSKGSIGDWEEDGIEDYNTTQESYFDAIRKRG